MTVTTQLCASTARIVWVRWTITTRPGGVVVAMGQNYSIGMGGGRVFSPSPTTITLPSGDYTITSVFEGIGIESGVGSGCDDPTFDSPHSQDFTVNCPTTLGLVLSTSYASFSRIFKFQPTFGTEDTTCPTFGFCTTIFDDLTIVATDPVSSNGGRHGDINFGPAQLLISGLAPLTDMTIFFRTDVVYASLPGFPPCSIAGTICKSFCGSATVNVDPCIQTACVYPTTIVVPMHRCIYGVDP